LTKDQYCKVRYVTKVSTLEDYLLGLQHDTKGSVAFRKFMKGIENG